MVNLLIVLGVVILSSCNSPTLPSVSIGLICPPYMFAKDLGNGNAHCECRKIRPDLGCDTSVIK